ncbi:MAG: phage tail tape measure protein, partial [Nitrosopumilus sp.]
EIAAYNEVKKKTQSIEKQHAVALQQNQTIIKTHTATVLKQILVMQKAHAVAFQQNQMLLKSEGLKRAKAEVQAYANQKRKVIALERQHAIALQENARYTQKAAAASAKIAAVHHKTVSTTREMIKSQKDLILSTKGVERVLSILIIRRIFHQIITQMREAITTTMDLHKALTEIQTISQTAPSSLDKWADSIIRVSNAWDIDLLDAANARYQILSNQVAKTAGETERFQVIASEFAKITKTTATSAVDLLSSALNAYSDSAVNAREVSAQLFKTIELGRIRSEDISSSFGRVVVVAAQLGIELAEVGATMAIITNKGIKASETMTLMRGIMMKLIKPTAAMIDLFEEWGVKTGEQAIATFGWLGVFQKIEEATMGAASGIGYLMGRIRATMGVTAVISDLEKFNDVLIQIRDTSKESYAKAAAMQFQTAGEKLSKELNLLKNTLVQGIGTEVVNVLADYNEGIVTITNTVIKLIDIATTLGITIGLIWSAKKLYEAALYLSMLRRHFITLKLLEVQTISTAAATEALIAVQAVAAFGITVAIYATVAALRAMYKSAKETREALEDLDEQYQRFVANQISVTEKQRTEYEKSVEAFRVAGQQSLQQNAAIAAASNRMIMALEERIEVEKDWIAEHQDLVEQDIKFTIDEYTKMYNFLIKESERYSKQIEKVEKQRLRTSEDFANLIEKAVREKYTPKENLKRLKEQEIQIRANRAASTGSLEEQIELIQEHKKLAIDILSLEKSISTTRRQAAVQQQADNARLRNRMLGIRGPIRKRKISDRAPEEALNTFIETMLELGITAENIYQDELSTLEKFYTRAKELAAGVKDEYQEIAVLINQIMKLLGKPAIKELGTQDEMEKRLREAIETGKPLKFDTTDFKAIMQEFINKLNIVDPIQKTIDALKENQIAIIENTNALMKTIQIQTKELSAAQIRGKEAENKVTDSLTTLDETFEKVLILLEEINKFSRFEGAGKSPLLALTDYIARAAGLRAETRIELFLETMKQHTEKLSEIDKMTTDEKLLYIDSLRSLLAQMDVMKDFVDESDLFGFEKLQKAFQDATVIIEDQVKNARVAADAWKEVNAELPALKEDLAATTEMIKAIRTNAQMVSESLKLYELSIDELTNNQMVTLRELLETFGLSLIKVNEILTTFGLNQKERRLELALGGSVWGTDTVPTRLTPGEFVVNQRSARKFYGMLSSINNGGALQGGDYSTTVGDLIVNVQGGDTSRQTVQSIMSGLRREIHRGKLVGI